MKNLIKLFSALLIALLFTFNISNAQTWTNYTTADGLVSNDVRAIAIDAQGNKWFGTYGGVSKFDGVNWTTYSTVDGLVSNAVRKIAIDTEGNIWFGTYSSGVSIFDGVNWTTFTTADGLGANDISAIAVDGDNIWVGTYYGGVSKFDGLNWTTYTTADGLGDNYVPDITVDFQGNIWFGTYGAGLSKFDGINWTTYNTADGLASNFVMSVAVDVQGNIWCGPHDTQAPISKFDGTTFTTYNMPNWGGGWCSAITTDLNGVKWIGTDHERYKFDDIVWTYLQNNSNRCNIAIDFQGNKWFGSDGNGVYELSDGGAGPVSSACVIKGNIFYDTNQNGILDSGETKLLGKMVEVLNDSTFYTTQSNGNFYIPRDTGTYQIRCVPANYWQFTTDSIITVYVSDTSTYISNIDFGIKIGDAISDVSVDIVGGPTRAGFDAHYWLTYKNEASVTKNGSVILTIDSLTSFVSSVPPPDSQNGNLITWNYTNLVPFEQRQVQLFLHMPDVSHLGDTLTTTAIINPVPGDMAPLNNYDTLHQVPTGSYDPNDKSVNKGTREQGYTLFGEELTYTIRFQNTGTDTAFTVQIRDTIDSDLDMASLRIVSSSHNVRLDVKNENVVTFIFENILLPDSNVNEPASNGFVKFAVKPKFGLPEYTEVTNKAYIFFDFNPAVITNHVLNTYVGNPFSGIEAITVDDQSMNMYPNPATNYLTIETTQPSQIEILNLQGQIIYESNFNEKNTSIDVSWFPAGLYFIKMSTAGNYAVAKFIKQ